jgi:diguanylate cyclase (GGDEF)-like protein
MRLVLLVVAAIGAFTAQVSYVSTDKVAGIYEDAARSELQAIAGTWDDGFRGTDLRRPQRLQRRIERLKRNNPNLHKISISWHDRTGGTLLVSAGHNHDPDGSKSDVTTSRVRRSAPGARPAPIDAADYGYRQVHAADGAHYAELNYAVRRGETGVLVAALELHYDLKVMDQALAADQRRIALAAAAAATVLALLLSFLLGRAVLRPLDQLRRATNSIRAGGEVEPLGWKRRDEIGDLARDFDRMAAELHESLKDPLTGLLNHRSFQERLGEELARARREGYPVSVIALDLDEFKAINDEFGHACGDEALRLVARAMTAELRPGDVCGRVGGDEFAIGIVRTGAEAAEVIVERIRSAVRAASAGSRAGRVTLSAGIAEFPIHADVQEELLHLADGAMYWAKTDGKNRSVVFSSDADLALSPAEAAERNLRVGLVNTVHALARAVDAKDGYTHQHSRRVGRYAAALASRLGISGDRLELIRTAGVLHDVGKIGISDAILLAPRPLTLDEFAVMRRHSELGRDIIAGAGMPDVAEWVLHLHERWDGGGYPRGLAGKAIPLESRLLHCADSLEAMTSSRVYRSALPLSVAIEELERGRGSAFDPDVADALLELLVSGALKIEQEDAETAPPAGSPLAATTPAGH